MLRRRWIFLTIMVVLGGGTAAYLGFTSAPHYTAKAQLLYQMEVQDGAERTDEVAVDTLVEMLVSPSHIHRLAESLDKDPGTITAQAPPITAETQPEAPADGAPEVAATMEPAVLDYEALNEGLNVYKERQSRLVAITFRSVDPETAAVVANRAVKLYLDLEADYQRESRARALESIAERIPDALARIDQAEGALRDHRIKFGLSDSAGSNQTDRQISELARQLSITKSDLDARDAQLDGLRLKRFGSLKSQRKDKAGYKMVAAKAEIGTEGNTSAPDLIGPEDPALRRLALDREAVSARLSDIESRLSNLQKASAATTSAWIRLRELEREANAAGQSYENLLHRKAALQGETIARPSARIVTTAAAPGFPSSPNPLLFVAPAIIASLIIGGLLAVLMERLDQRLRSERDVEETLGTPCIGLVPKITLWQRASLPKFMREKPFAPYTEAIRSIYVAATRQSAQSILVTSSTRGEGKSMLILGLAVYAARLGQRVLVIDFDLRHPQLLGLLGEVKPNGKPVPMQDEDDMTRDPFGEMTIRTAEKYGIDYLSPPKTRLDPLTLLSSRDFPTLLEHLRRNYDCILIDSAPVTDATETRILASMVDRVLFTVRWGVTDAGSALVAVQQLRTAAPDEAVPISVVVNQVKLGAHRSGHYSEPVPIST